MSRDESDGHPTSWSEWGKWIVLSVKALLQESEENTKALVELRTKYDALDAKIDREIQHVQAHVTDIDRHGSRTGAHVAVTDAPAPLQPPTGFWGTLFAQTWLPWAVAVLAILLAMGIMVIALTDRSASDLNPFAEEAP